MTPRHKGIRLTEQQKIDNIRASKKAYKLRNPDKVREAERRRSSTPAYKEKRKVKDRVYRAKKRMEREFERIQRIDRGEI